MAVRVALRYRGVPTYENTDPAHRYRSGIGQSLSLREWRALWGGAVAIAQQLVVFSASSARIVADAYPQAQDKIVVEPHELVHVLQPLPR